MKRLTLEWVQKAESGFEIMEREGRARSGRVYDGVCFHAQQCAGKYLKARLYEAAIPFQRTHDLTALLEQVLTVEPVWEARRADLGFLVDFAVSIRYPSGSADRRAHWTPAPAVAAC